MARTRVGLIALAAVVLTVPTNSVGASSDSDAFCVIAAELHEHLQETFELQEVVLTDDTEVDRERLADELELAEETTFEYVAEMFDVAPIDARAALRMFAEDGLVDTSEAALESIEESVEEECGFSLFEIDLSDRVTVNLMVVRVPTTTTTTSSTVPPSTIEPPSRVPRTTTPVPTTGDIYTVVQGDTLFAISQKLGVRLPDLVAANGLNENSLIAPGQQQLVVPRGDSTVTTLFAGDTIAVVPSETSASCQSPDSEAADGTPIVFSPANVLDDDPATVWRYEASAMPTSLTFTFDAPTRLTSVGLIGGYVKVDPLTGVDRFPQNHRVRQVQWTFDGTTTVTQDLADSLSMQTLPVDVTATSVTMLITSTYPPGGEAPRDMMPVAEVVLTSTVQVNAPTTTGPECEYVENDELPSERCDAGPAVAAAQSVLQAREYEIGTVDCLFGDQMHYAVQAFQADQGLAVIGEIDADDVGRPRHSRRLGHRHQRQRVDRPERDHPDLRLTSIPSGDGSK